MKKLLIYLKNHFKEFIHRSKINRQVLNTKKLREKKRTDINRWEENRNLYKDWDERTAILGSLVENDASVIEFGAGNKSLRKYIPGNCFYTPTDIVRRSSDFLICDLNETIDIDLSNYDTAVFSGVLEYVYDIDKVFEQLPDNIRTVLLSYSCKDISQANRLENGWLSDYSSEELEEIFLSHQYILKDLKLWRNQSIYKLER
jgi:hypothetical protein